MSKPRLELHVDPVWGDDLADGRTEATAFRITTCRLIDVYILGPEGRRQDVDLAVVAGGTPIGRGDLIVAGDLEVIVTYKNDETPPLKVPTLVVEDE